MYNSKPHDVSNCIHSLEGRFCMCCVFLLRAIEMGWRGVDKGWRIFLFVSILQKIYKKRLHFNNKYMYHFCWWRRLSISVISVSLRKRPCRHQRLSYSNMHESDKEYQIFLSSICIYFTY